MLTQEYHAKIDFETAQPLPQGPPPPLLNLTIFRDLQVLITRFQAMLHFINELFQKMFLFDHTSSSNLALTVSNMRFPLLLVFHLLVFLVSNCNLSNSSLSYYAIQKKKLTFFFSFWHIQTIKFVFWQNTKFDHANLMFCRGR